MQPRVVEIERHPDVFRKVIERPERQDPERRVGSGNRGRDCADRSVAAPSHDHPRAASKCLAGDRADQLPFNDAKIRFDRAGAPEYGRDALHGAVVLRAGV